MIATVDRIGRDKRQDDREEDPRIAAPVDEGGLDQLEGKLAERIAQEEDADRQPESHLRQDDAPMRVEQAEVADLDEERQDRGRERKGEAEDQVVEEKSVAEELQMREGEGRRSTTPPA